jgi:hypothetical protein
VWEKFYGATPDEIRDWRSKLDASLTDPLTAQLLRSVDPGRA